MQLQKYYIQIESDITEYNLIGCDKYSINVVCKTESQSENTKRSNIVFSMWHQQNLITI